MSRILEDVDNLVVTEDFIMKFVKQINKKKNNDLFETDGDTKGC